MNNKLLISIIASILFLGAGGGLVGGYHTLKTKMEEVVKDVDEVEEEVEETEDKVVENEKVDIEQTILIKRTLELLEKLNLRIDKELEDE